MSVNSYTNIKTVVRFVYILVIALTLVYATAYAEDKSPPTGQQLILGTSDGCEVGTTGNDCRLKKDCASSKKDLIEKITDMDKVCTVSGSGSNFKTSCAQKYKECLGSPTTVAQSDDIWAQLLGKPKTQIVKNCDIKPRDYFTQNKDLTSQIKGLDKDIKQLQDEDTKLDEDYQGKIVKLQEAFAKEQEDLEKLQEEAQNKNMEDEKAALEQDQKSAKDLLQLESNKMSLRNKLNDATRTAQTELLGVSEQIAQGDCIRQVKKFKQENAASLKFNSAAGLIGTSNKVREELQSRFDACMEIMRVRRETISAKLTETVATVNAELQNIETNIQQIQESQKQSQVQRQQRIQLMADKKEKAIKRSVQKTQQLQAQLTQEGELLKKRHATNGQAQLDAKQAKTKLNAQLLSLGPDGGNDISGDKSLNDDIRTYDKYTKAFADFNSICCNGQTDDFCTNTAPMRSKSGLTPTNKYKKTEPKEGNQ